MRNSIKQLFRSPFKVLLFFLLTAAGTALLVFGVNLWTATSRSLRELEGSFTTIGTARQIADSVAVSSQWDAATKSYTNYDQLVYDAVIPVEVLDFEGANYIHAPEKRPYYGAYVPQYNTSSDVGVSSVSSYLFVAEFTPLEDCIPSEPVRVKIVDILYGDVYGSDEFWFCDHYNEHPEALEKGKTYIAYLFTMENAHVEAQLGTAIECTPLFGFPFSTQYDRGGQLLDSELNTNENRLNNNLWEEVTEGFLEAGRRQIWLNFIEALQQREKVIPVLPASSLTLLPAFHNGESSILEGREISREEFEAGARVCLVTDQFAQLNGLRVGDDLTLSLLFADYRTAPGYAYAYDGGFLDYSLLNARGELYSVFWEEAYRIVGTYRFTGGQTFATQASEMGRDEVIIPAKSVRASDASNIADYGPMQSGTTSFQIPNGTIAAFEAAVQELPESGFLQITYYDNGYEQISANLQSMKHVAVLLTAAALLSTLAILIFLLYFFIVKQQKRTAIECSLGLTKRQCRISLISGIMVVAVVAMVAGSALSTVAGQGLSPALEQQSGTTYSLKYSNWVQEAPNADLDEAQEQPQDIAVSMLVPALLLLFIMVLSVILVNRNLKREPIELLSAGED